jgi:hypothetical protein
MSHNKLKVGTAEPDRVGDVSLSINNLSDVDTTSAVSGQYLTYNGSDWGPTSAVAGGVPGIVFVGEGATSNYSGSGASGVAVNDDIEFYATSPGNTISSATVTSSSNWVSSVTLPAGKFRLTAVAGLELSASSGLLEYRWHNGSSLVGATGNAGYTDDRVGNPCVVYVELTGSTTFTVRITTATSVTALASQTGRQSERGYIVIEQIGES